MDLKDKKTRESKLTKSFMFAFQGIVYVMRHERNMKIHLSMTFIVLFFSIFFQISKVEWLIVLLTIGGMLAFEAVNTAIERAVDLVTTDFHPYAKIAKDAAAGASLIFAVISAIIGIVIFFPYIYDYFK